jgi:16S rRNA A1518/A1519 N6-dimethyltransferase RsmA/KsgA/DIM1 with predicted DNA glycosylase/AP lyase activity
MPNTAQKQQYFGKDLEDLTVARNYYKWIIAIFKPYLGNIAAEIGAGSGNFTDFLAEEGIKRIFAFEPSSNIYPLLSDKFKKNANVTSRRKIPGILKFF